MEDLIGIIFFICAIIYAREKRKNKKIEEKFQKESASTNTASNSLTPEEVKKREAARRDARIAFESMESQIATDPVSGLFVDFDSRKKKAKKLPDQKDIRPKKIVGKKIEPKEFTQKEFRQKDNINNRARNNIKEQDAVQTRSRIIEEEHELTMDEIIRRKEEELRFGNESNHQEIPEEAHLMEIVENLMITGPSTAIPNERDFLGEGMKMLENIV